ncbi:type II secretion system F family protein [Desulfobacterium sp. N47]|uniref:type II secretion system F family protein n=1 Tax=Desulfobacterium sp. N47 TaxID=3115210 RepID=UPI003F49E8D1
MEFAYRSLDPAGQESRGSITAADYAAALEMLKARGIVVTGLTEKKARAGSWFAVKRNFNDEDMYNIAREMSTLLRSGMRIDKAFDILIHATEKQDLREVLLRIIADIKAGKGVAQAFDNTGRFGPLVISMIHVSEAVGELREAFENIARYLRFQIQFRAEVRNAMSYPAFLVFASGVTFFVIFQFIVPRFFSIFGPQGTRLPLPAKALYAISGWFNFTSIGIMAGLVVGFLVLRRLNPGKIKAPNLYHYLIFIPIIRKLVLNLEMSRFSYSMYTMLQSGVEFIKALKLSSALIQNEQIKGPIASLVGQIKEGKKIADVFEQVHILPPIVPNMIRVGEESGNLKDIFLELYQVFDERFRNGIKRLLSLLEPVIIIAMGLIVGFIVITLILTVMSVSNIKM